MKERPILFIAPMVRSLLDDSKTQTRRVVKADLMNDTNGATDAKWYFRGKRSACWDSYETLPELVARHCPYGKPGDRLRVKEAAWMWCERRPNGTTKTGRKKWLYVPMREAPIHYAADHPHKPAINVVSQDTGNQWGWRLKIGRFLPAWASRITLEITDRRVERLNEISRADAAAEGICSMAKSGDKTMHQDGYPVILASNYPEENYKRLWESINGAGSWAQNPWVWVLEFKRVELKSTPPHQPPSHGSTLTTVDSNHGGH